MFSASPIGSQDLDLGGEYRSSTDSAVDRVSAELALSGYQAIRQLNCGCHGSAVTIAGLLPTFHQKQVALSLVMRCLPKGTQFDDDIYVAHVR